MTQAMLPQRPSDLLDIPSEAVPDVIHNLLKQRALSSLMARIHEELGSRDPALQTRARQALQHLGFPE